MKPKRVLLWHLAYTRDQAIRRGVQLAERLGYGWFAEASNILVCQIEPDHPDAIWMWSVTNGPVTVSPVSEAKYCASVEIYDDHIREFNKDPAVALERALERAGILCDSIEEIYTNARAVVSATVERLKRKPKLWILTAVSKNAASATKKRRQSSDGQRTSTSATNARPASGRSRKSKN